MAVHKRAMRLLGLPAWDSNEAFPFDCVPKHQLEGFVIEQKRDRERQRAWDIYYQDGGRTGHRGNRR